jgi:hypothetical protein
MRIAAFVPLGLLGRLRQASSEQSIHSISSLSSFRSAFRSEHFDGFVLDPSVILGKQRDILTETLESEKKSVVIYVSPTPTALRYTLEILHLGVCQLIVCDYGDDSKTLRRALNALPHATPAVSFIVNMREPLSRLNSTLMTVLLGVLTGGPIPAAKAIGTAMSSSRRSVDRWLLDADLKPASWFLSIARFLRVIPKLEAGTSTDAIVLYGSYSSRDSFERDVRRITGLTYDQAAELARSDPSRLTALLAAKSVLNASEKS